MVAVNIRQNQAGHPLGFFDAPQPELGWVPLWQTATRNFQLGPVPNLYGAYDFIVGDRADLADVVAPVGNVFVLPNGSYAQVGDVTLNAGESIEVPAGGEVFWQGMGADEFLSTSGGVTSITVNGRLDCKGLQLIGAGDTAIGITVSVTGQIKALASQVTMVSGAGMTAMGISGGFNELIGFSIDGSNTVGLVIAGGQTQWTGGRCTSVAACLQGGASDGLVADNVWFQAITGSNLLMSGANADQVWKFTGCKFEKQGAAAPNIEVADPAARLDLTACKFLGAGNSHGINVDDDLTDMLSVKGCNFGNLLTGILYSNGTVDGAAVAANDFGADVVTAVSWPSGTIPTDGLLFMGNTMKGTNSIVGHVQTDARVNWKCNSFNGALLVETAIV